MTNKDNAKPEQTPRFTTPVDVVDGIPDRGPSPRPWKYAMIVLIFLAWVLFLVAAAFLGAP